MIQVVSPQALARFNLVMTFVWLILVVPSVLFWSQSLLWIVLMSAYAVVVGHFSSWAAARAEVATERGNKEAAEERELVHGDD